MTFENCEYREVLLTLLTFGPVFTYICVMNFVFIINIILFRSPSMGSPAYNDVLSDVQSAGGGAHSQVHNL